MPRPSLAPSISTLALIALITSPITLSAQHRDSIPGLDPHFVRAPRPKAPVLVGGACPFECCHYGKWTLRTDAAVRRTPSDGAPVSFNLRSGQPVFADTGFVRIDTIGIVVLRKHHADAMYKTPYEAGDTLLVLNYLGEGQYFAWWRGYSIETESFWDSLGEVPGPKTVGSTIRELSMRWWARARDARGRRGWLDMEKVEVSGADGCG